MILRLQVGFQLHSPNARDENIITPHFSAAQITQGVDADQLCEDLATALVAWNLVTCQTRVKAYDAQGTPPVNPIGEAVRNVGIIATPNHPREVALCLSFFAGQNQPRRRGRLYIPSPMAHGDSPGRAPASAALTNVGALANIFANLGGADVDWVVYSRVDNVARPVSNWWVDDEWDTIRSRGGRSTTRASGTVNE